VNSIVYKVIIIDTSNFNLGTIIIITSFTIVISFFVVLGYYKHRFLIN